MPAATPEAAMSVKPGGRASPLERSVDRSPPPQYSNTRPKLGGAATWLRVGVRGRSYGLGVRG